MKKYTKATDSGEGGKLYTSDKTVSEE